MNIKVAIQKSGRLNEESLRIFKECAIKVTNYQNALKVTASNFPLEVYNLRNSDIPEYVEDGIADLGIVGENTLLEKQKEVKVIRKLGFGKCRLSIAVPKEVNYTDLSYLNGKKIATSYPFSLKSFLKENNLTASIHEISGSVEIAPNIGLADAILDLVESGNTLFMNGLKEVETIMHSEAVLVANKNLSPEKEEILEQILFRIESTYKAKENKYIVMNVPNEKINEVTKLLPGMRSPSIIPLKEEGWSAIHTVLPEKEFWTDIDQMRKLGAEGILVIPIEKMIL